MNAGIRKTMAGIILGSQAVSVSFSTGAITGAGSDETDAELLLDTVNNVAGADGTVGVILPSAQAGQLVFINNTVAAQGLKVYPPSGWTINGGTADVAVTIAGKTMAVFICTNGTNWGAIFTAA
jgi:hypothetical protein